MQQPPMWRISKGHGCCATQSSVGTLELQRMDPAWPCTTALTIMFSQHYFCLWLAQRGATEKESSNHFQRFQPNHLTTGFLVLQSGGKESRGVLLLLNKLVRLQMWRGTTLSKRRWRTKGESCFLWQHASKSWGDLWSVYHVHAHDVGRHRWVIFTQNHKFSCCSLSSYPAIREAEDDSVYPVCGHLMLWEGGWSCTLLHICGGLVVDCGLLPWLMWNMIRWCTLVTWPWLWALPLFLFQNPVPEISTAVNTCLTGVLPKTGQGGKNTADKCNFFSREC